MLKSRSWLPMLEVSCIRISCKLKVWPIPRLIPLTWSLRNSVTTCRTIDFPLELTKIMDKYKMIIIMEPISLHSPVNMLNISTVGTAKTKKNLFIFISDQFQIIISAAINLFSCIYFNVFRSTLRFVGTTFHLIGRSFYILD